MPAQNLKFVEKPDAQPEASTGMYSLELSEVSKSYGRARPRPRC